MKELLKEKQIIKKKTPDFIRTAGKSKVRLKNSGWRRPKGITNKMRLQEHGHRVIVKKGYGTPSKIRGIGKDGRTQILITNINDLKKVGKNDKAIIASALGLRKKIQIIDEAKKLKIEIVNVNDDKISKKLEAINSKRQEQKNKKDKREKKKQASEKKTDKEKKPVDEKVSEEQQKKEEKKAKDDILTHKD